MARNYWTPATAELVAEYEIDLQLYMEKKGLNLDDYLTTIEIAPDACIESHFSYRTGYIKPLKIRESFAVVCLWLYKGYCQEEPAPEDYHTIKLCNTKECIQPNHYIDIPNVITAADFRRFVESALGRYWYQEFLKRGTWAKAWEAVWQALEAAPELGVELIAKSASIPVRHFGMASDVKALEILKESWDINSSPYIWYHKASLAYRRWTSTLASSPLGTGAGTISLDTMVNQLTEEQKMVLLNKLQTEMQCTATVVAPFEQEV